MTLAGFVEHMLHIVRPEVLLAALVALAGIDVVEHHALRQQLGKRLVDLDQPQIAHHLGPEARVQQVQDGVLDTADVLVHAATAGAAFCPHPVFGTAGHHGVRIVRIAIAHEVPRAVHKGVHGVGFASRRLAAHRAHHARVKTFVLVQRVAGAIGHAVLRQHHGQVFLGHRHGTMLVAMDDRNRRAPVTLAAHAPVAQAPGGFLLAQALGHQIAATASTLPCTSGRRTCRS